MLSDCSCQISFSRKIFTLHFIFTNSKVEKQMPIEFDGIWNSYRINNAVSNKQSFI